MKNLKNNVSGVLALIATVLYVTGYWICELFYYDDITKWRLLRDTLTGIDIGVLVLLNFLPDTRLKKASLLAFGVFCIGNLVDRLFFNVSTFVIWDWVIIAGAAAVFIKTIRANENPGIP